MSCNFEKIEWRDEREGQLMRGEKIVNKTVEEELKTRVMK